MDKLVPQIELSESKLSIQYSPQGTNRANTEFSGYSFIQDSSLM